MRVAFFESVRLCIHQAATAIVRKNRVRLSTRGDRDRIAPGALEDRQDEWKQRRKMGERPERAIRSPTAQASPLGETFCGCDVAE